MREFSDHDCVTVKAATASSYEALGGVTHAAKLLGVGSSTLTKYASTGADWRESFIRLDLAVALDRATEHPFLFNAMTQLVQREPVASFGAVTASAILRLDGVLEDVVREVARALDDDVIDAGERLAVRNRIAAAQRDLARLDAMMIGGGT